MSGMPVMLSEYSVTRSCTGGYKYPNSSSPSEVTQDVFKRTNSLSGHCGNKSRLSHTDLILCWKRVTWCKKRPEAFVFAVDVWTFITRSPRNISRWRMQDRNDLFLCKTLVFPYRSCERTSTFLHHEWCEMSHHYRRYSISGIPRVK